MAIPLPNLDTHTYQDFVEDAQALIPNLFPEWTNHNPTDPGIVLIELLAWLTEMVLYRVNQIPEENYVTFLKLLNGPGWKFDGEGPHAVQKEIRLTMLKLRERYRAATQEDFEVLALEAWGRTPEARALGSDGIIQRVRCLPQTNLSPSLNSPLQPAPGHVTLIIVPGGKNQGTAPQPSMALRTGLWRFLDTRRLLTTRHHVVGPTYVTIHIKATLHLHDDASGAATRQSALDRLQSFFHPLHGGADGHGWPFGRDIHLAEIYEQLDKVPGVDFVKNVRLQAPDTPEREQMRDPGVKSPTTIMLHDHELVSLTSRRNDFITMEREGQTWRRTTG